MKINTLSEIEFKAILFSGLLNAYPNNDRDRINIADEILNSDDALDKLHLNVNNYLILRKDVELLKLNPILHILGHFTREKSIQNFLYTNAMHEDELSVYLKTNRIVKIDDNSNILFPHQSDSNFIDFELDRECLSEMKNSCFYPEISSILNHSRRSIYSSNHLSGLINSSKFLKNKDLEDYYSSNIRIEKDTIFIHVQDFFEGGTQLLALSFAKYLQSIGKNVMVLTQDDTGYLSNEFERFKICYLKIDLNDISTKLKLKLGVENSHTLISFSSVNLLALIEYQKLGMDCFLSFNEPFEKLDQETLEIFLTFLKSGKCFSPYFNADFVKFLDQRDIHISDENSRICHQIKTGIPFLTNTTLNYSKSNKKAFREKFDIKPGSLILGSLASGIFRKGFDRLEGILENCDSETYFLWVGKVDLNLLNKFPKNLILIENLPSEDFFDIIDIYCCLSRNDVYPMSVTESLMRNIPTITFDPDSCGQNNFSSNELITAGDGSSERFSQLINDFRYNNNRPVPYLNNLVFTGEHSRGYFFQKILKLMGANSPTVSVVLPYYNHSNFSFKRLQSILMQDMPVNEIVMLNDGSTDQGFELYRSLSKSDLDYKFKVIENESNQGNVFQQWIKGINESTSDYIWIAETDDFSHPSFTLELLQALSKESVTFASCDSIHISDNGNIIANRNPHFEESNLKSFSFETPFNVSGNTLIEQALGIYNCIPNVSACLFKTKFLKKAINNISSDLITLKYAGDWLLYLELATMGDVTYSPLKLNYFTKSNQSTIGASDKNRLIDEIAFVQQRAQQKGFHTEKFLKSQVNYFSEVNRLRMEP